MTTLAQQIDAVEAVLGTAAGITRSQTYDELGEGAQDLPMLQVYPQSSDCDVTNAGTERTTFGKGVNQKERIIIADLVVTQRKHIAQDMGRLVGMIDAMEAVLNTQWTGKFGLTDIKAHHWSWERVVYTYGDPQLNYVGARFTITLRIF